MASQSGLVWQTAPSQHLMPNLASYQERLDDAILGLAEYFAARMETFAKTHARWQDRTGAARAGLRGFAVRQAAVVILYLVTSVAYGKWLELALGGRYAIIMSTIQAHHAEVMRAYRSLVGR